MKLRLIGRLRAVFTPQNVNDWTARRMPLTLVVDGRMWPDLGSLDVDPELVDQVSDYRVTLWCDASEHETVIADVRARRSLSLIVSHDYTVSERDGKRYTRWVDTVIENHSL